MMQNQRNHEGQQNQELMAPSQISMAVELVGGEAYPLIASYIDLNQYDNDLDELYYHNVATCPDCGQGMMRVGDQLSCPGCGG